METSSQEALRRLPKIDRLLAHPMLEAWKARAGAEQVRGAAREAVERARVVVLEGGECPPLEDVLQDACERLEAWSRPTLRPVINATGVVIHTNLGRAPLSEEALRAMAEVGRGYSNLEFDLDAGERGSRYEHCARQIAALAGAEAALVVNNNAAAVLLVLSALVGGRQVVVSRGQLVEIGGGFRIPDVMRQSGAELVEVGTTNRTYARDYEEAIGERAAALMVVHRSNFQLTGFVHDPAIEELAGIARARGLLLLDDLGSGTFLDTARFGLSHEPTVQERVAAGPDLVLFSGDKLLGGPQAGYIAGRKPLIERLERFPLLRALRVDKVTLAGIEATLRHYQREEAVARIPVWRAIAARPEELEERATGWMRSLALDDERAQVVESESTVGGGSLPGLTVPTRALAISVERPDVLARQLRAAEVPVVGRVEAGRLILDPRTVLPGEDERLVRSVAWALGRAV